VTLTITTLVRSARHKGGHAHWSSEVKQIGRRGHIAARARTAPLEIVHRAAPCRNVPVTFTLDLMHWPPSMETVISIVGSIASIFGALWALWEAKKAKRSADRAEQVRSELGHRRDLAEVAQIYAETKRLLTVVARVGPTSTQQLMRGVNCAEIAREIEAYVRLLLEQKKHFAGAADHATALSGELRPDIEALAEAKTFEDRKRHGKSIYYKIENFSSIVKQLADAKHDRSDVI
jgi:hypothetical protein